MSATIELLVTEKCNLSCPYCYVANKNKFMTKETFDKKFDQLHDLVQRTGEKNYHISFFGGEPLLNWELVKYAIPKFKADPLCVGIVLISNMTLIDKEKSDFLLQHGVGVSWSFDGITSNETRPLLKTPENEGYYGTAEGILKMYEDKKELILRHIRGCKFMVWPGNSQLMTENLEFFAEWGIPFPDYSLVRDDVWTVEDIKNFKDDLRKLGDRTIKYINEENTLIMPGFFSLSIMDSMLGLAKGKRPFGCFAGCRGVAIMPDGEVYPCARFGSKRIMEIDNNYDFSYYQKQFRPENYDKCKNCNLNKVCNAGCTYSQVRNDNKPLDSICELYHIITEESYRVLRECKDSTLFQQYFINAFNNIG